MNVPKLDTRLVGLKPKDITIKFVQDNATEEEIAVAKYYKEPSKTLEYVGDIETYVLGRGTDVITSLRGILNKVQKALQDGYEVESWHDMAGHGLEVKKPIFQENSVYGKEALQLLWKDKIRERLTYEKERIEYLRLRDKFEEGGKQ